MHTVPAMRVVVQAVLAALVLGVIGTVSVAAGQPLLVPSLGAAVLLQVHLPDLPSARPWNTAVGQFCGALCGFGAVYALGITGDPGFAAGHPLLAERVLGCMLAVATTLMLQAATRATNPAGAATALIVALGSEAADWTGFGRLATAILLITALGEAGRRIVLHTGR